MLTVQILKGLSTFIIPKHLTPRGRLRECGGGPMGSSFPRHSARIWTKTQSKKKKPRGDYKLEQKQYRTKINMMHEQIKCSDA